MSLFKGFTQVETLTMEPRLMCAILSEQLAKTNEAGEAMAEQLKQLHIEIAKLKQNKEG